MGRGIENPVRMYYSYDCVRDVSKCCIRGCNKLIKGNHAANLERHVSRLHPFEHIQLMEMKERRSAVHSGTGIVFGTLGTNMSLGQDIIPQGPTSPQKQPVPSQQVTGQAQKKTQLQQTPTPKPIAPKPPQRPVSPVQPPPPPPEVCLRWNSYHSNMQATFPSLLNNEQFVDVTLACEGRSIKCHKMMLSACSAYFEELLSQNPCQHPIVLMKDLRYWEVQALVDFMYRGEVNVGQDKLPSLLAAAEALQIKGLAGPASSTPEEESPSSSVPMGSAEEYLEESAPSPSSTRRARKRRVMNTTSSGPQQPVQTHVPVSTQSRTSMGRQRLIRPAQSLPSTSHFTHDATSLSSEPPARRARKSEAEFVGEIKIEPIDIEISNDSMDQIDESFMDKAYDGSETGEGGESSGHGDDPGGTGESLKANQRDSTNSMQVHESDQINFNGNNGMTSSSEQTFKYEDPTVHDGDLQTSVPDIRDPGFSDALGEPSGSGMSSGPGGGNLTDSLLGHM